MAKRNPKAYEPDLAIDLSTLGINGIEESKVLYSDVKEDEVNEQQFQESVAYLEEALVLFRKHASLETISYWYDKCLSTLADAAFAKNDFDKSMLYMEELIPLKKEAFSENPEAYQTDYADHMEILSMLCLILEEFPKAEEYATTALSVDPERHGVNANLAAALLFQGKYDKAEEIYLRYKDELGEMFLKDLEAFEEIGYTDQHLEEVDRIKKLLKKE